MSLFITLAAVAAALGVALVAWRVIRDDRARSAARVAALAAHIDAAPSAPDTVPGVHALFADEARAVPRGRLLLKVAAGFAAAVLIILTVAMVTGRSPAEDAKPAASDAQDSGLELLSMRHDREGDTLTVTGLVRNQGARPTERVTAVAFAFDRDGGFLTSGRAPLDFAVLAPGDESPFRIVIPHVTDVGRYRVSFRTDAGVVRHVDRRALQTAAK